MGIASKFPKKLHVLMLGFGLLIGVVFPFFVILLGVPASIAITPAFMAACLAAGALSGWLNYLLCRALLMRPVRQSLDLTETVVSIAGQISASGQSLSDGATDQAASLRRTTASMDEMASVTRRNADSVSQVNGLFQEANLVVMEASQNLAQLTKSMEGMNSFNQEAGKVIRIIDEIAFQTNMLALNAAVEAARAGEAGLSFAVVADEVRNLASRSAEAARNTARLIEGAIENTKEGLKTVEVANASFNDVAEHSEKVARLLGEIVQANNAQVDDIEDVNHNMASIETVTQQNAVSAEEAAAIAERLNSQAVTTLESVGRLENMLGSAGKKLANGNDCAP